MQEWLTLPPRKPPNRSSTAKRIDYSRKRRPAPVHYLADGALPIDVRSVEYRIRSVAPGRSIWLFAESLRAGQRAPEVMSLVQSAKLNGHDPHRYLDDELERLPTHPISRIDEALPHRSKAVRTAGWDSSGSIDPRADRCLRRARTPRHLPTPE